MEGITFKEEETFPTHHITEKKVGGSGSRGLWPEDPYSALF